MASTLQRIRDCDPELVELRLTKAPEAYSDDPYDLIDALRKNTTIEYIRLDRDFLPCIDDHDFMSKFFLAIGMLPALTEAHILHASIPVSALAVFLQKARKLNVLALGCLDLGGTASDFDVLSDCLMGHTTLSVFKMVDFSLCDGSISIDGFVKTLATIPNLSHVRLEVSRCRRGSVVGTEAAARKVSVPLTGPALAVLFQAPNLAEITLTRLNLKLDDFEALADAIKSAKSLKSLSIQHCCLDDTGCDTVARALGANKTIEKIDFSCNKLTDEGCLTIATALRDCQSMRLLRLWGNVKISNAGFDAVNEMLQHNCALEHIEIMSPPSIKIDTASRNTTSQAAPA